MLIIIHGIPGIGKSTLAAKLNADLGLRYIAQDMIKEFYADTLGGQFTPQESDAMGRAAKHSVLELARELVQTGASLMVEGAFRADAATKLVEQLPDTPIVQLYVTCEQKEAKRRFLTRTGTDSRHSIHTDTLYEAFSMEAIRHRYRPLDVAAIRTLRYDTTRESDHAYQTIVTELRKELDHAKTN